MKELGIFCGTFNPIHWGHLLIAEHARIQYKLEKVLFITSARPPHRSSDPGLLAPEKRHKMMEAAIAGNDYFEPSSLEIDRLGPSYSIDTLLELNKLYGSDYRLNMIIGADNLGHLREWHKADDLFKQCRFLIAPRPTQEHNNGAQEQNMNLQIADIKAADMAWIASPVIPISSTEIRLRLLQGKSVLYMVPQAVHDILIAENLYAPRK